ncbi:MAG: hypothetical protein ABI354_02860 [Candidatus Saccharimonadales bacterium]
MRIQAAKFKPTKGYAHVVHVFLSALMPALVFIFVRIDVAAFAVAVVLISKWRMFAVRPHFWPAIVRANAVDIMVSLSTIVFMTHTRMVWLQLFWVALFMIWQVFVKPGRSMFSVSAQAFIGQTYGLMAIFLGWPAASTAVIVLAVWVICYMAARHFLTSFDEPYVPMYARTWSYFAAGLAWLSSHWLLYYSVVAQPTLFLTVLGFSLGGLYYLKETDRLSLLYRRQIVFIMLAVIIVVLVFSDWGDKTL